MIEGKTWIKPVRPAEKARENWVSLLARNPKGSLRACLFSEQGQSLWGQERRKWSKPICSAEAHYFSP